MYGVTNFSLEGEEKELILCVGGIRDHALLSSTKEVKLNGIKFVRAIIDGFELLKKHVVDSKSKISGVVCEKSQV
ncbi:MAG: hypothetical protein AB2691_20295 [Candidatus Thiodiazotropha sp.]